MPRQQAPPSHRSTSFSAYCVLAICARFAAADSAEVWIASHGSGNFEIPFAANTLRPLHAWRGELGAGEISDAAAEFDRGASENDLEALLREAQPLRRGAEVVLGSDDRGRVADATAFPARAIGRLTFVQQGLRYLCTGFLIGRSTVATAGHCVHAGGTGEATDFSTDVRFFPGLAGSLAPYGSCGARTVAVPKGWFEVGDETGDFGAVELSCEIGREVGFFGLAALTREETLRTLVTVQGYPGDKGPTPSLPGTEQWRSTGRLGAVEPLQVFYENDTFGGQSGSPVFELNRDGCGQCAVAIHAYGVHPFVNARHLRNNHGTRVTTQLRAAFAAMRAARN